MTRAEQRQRIEAMKAYKAEGHSHRETAARFGMSLKRTKTICRGISPQGGNQYTCDSERAENARLERITKTVEANAPGFEYVGGYTGEHGTILIRCRKCGNIETRSWNVLRHKAAKGKKGRCESCYQEEIRRKAEARAAEKAAKQAEEKAAREKARWDRALENATQLTFKVCKECGNIFVPGGKTRCYCSDKCRKRALNNHKDRRLKGKGKDPSITLQKVFARDGGVCYLCGGRCDWSDYERKEGKKIAGNNYPSIDHVIPLAHNGTHTWGNVRLAHRWCNTMKSDSPRCEPAAIPVRDRWGAFEKACPPAK